MKEPLCLSVLCQKQTRRRLIAMSALPPNADIHPQIMDAAGAAAALSSLLLAIQYFVTP